MADDAYRSSNSTTVSGLASANVSAKMGNEATATHAAVCQYSERIPSWSSRAKRRAEAGMKSSVKLWRTMRFSAATGWITR